MGNTYKNKIKNKIEHINTESSYWMGFIAADGCISNLKLAVQLAIKDINLLILLKNWLDINNKIQEGISKRKNKLHQYCRFSVSISPLEATILKNIWSIEPRKSFNLKPPNLNDPNCILAYIKGYIDGDGHIGIKNDKQTYKNKTTIYKRLRVEIVGTKDLLIWIKNSVETLLNVKINSSIRQKNKNNNNIYTLELTNKKLLSKIMPSIYKSSVYGLNRKWDRIKEYYNL